MTEKDGREKIKADLLEEVRKSASKAELQRIKRVREMDKIDRQSPLWPLGCAVDPMRMQYRKARSVVEKSLWMIQNLKVKAYRLETEIDSGKIRDEVKPGVPMTPEEALLEQKYAEWLIEGELQSLPLALWEMSPMIDQPDVGGTIICPREEFDAYLEHVNDRVRELVGTTLF